MTTCGTRIVTRRSQVLLGDASDNWEVVRQSAGEPDDVLAVVQTGTLADALVSLLALSSDDKAVLGELFSRIADT